MTSNCNENQFQNIDLTVVIPVYNGMPFLESAIESILKQTYSRFHLLVIDDGSSDESLAWLQTINDPRLIIISQKNKGLCHTLNESIISLKTKYVARLDQDDVAFSYRLFEQRKFLEENKDYVAVLGNHELIGKDGRTFGSNIVYDLTKPVVEYSSKTFGSIAHSTLMTHVDIFKSIGGYREIMYPADDYDLLLRLEEVAKIALLTRPMARYRLHWGGATFKTYSTMNWKLNFASENAQKRRRGEREILPETFLKNYAQRDLAEKISSNLTMFGRFNFKKAGLNISEENIFIGLLQLAVAFFFAPKYSLERIIRVAKTKGWARENGMIKNIKCFFKW